MASEPRSQLPSVFSLLFLLVVGCNTQSPPNEDMIRDALRNEVQFGMTTAQVEELLGKGDAPSEMESKVLKLSMTKPSDPSMAPDGYDADDVFYYYTLDGIKVFIQFRDDKLINFNPGLY